eukprot:642827-Prymnesium_polylepis.1
MGREQPTAAGCSRRRLVDTPRVRWRLASHADRLGHLVAFAFRGGAASGTGASRDARDLLGMHERYAGAARLGIALHGRGSQRGPARLRQGSSAARSPRLFASAGQPDAAPD